MNRFFWMLTMALALVACDDDRDTDAGSGDTDSGPAVMGCAEMGGPMCPGGQMCCSGVPYPTEGVCQDQCTAVSDRRLKEGLRPVDGDAVLSRLAELEVREWSYRADDTRARHVGPMAQDFHAAFGVGHDDTVINQVDADGVLMVSVQALNRRLEALERDNEALREDNARLEARVRELEER